ncbi:MAG: aminoacyl-tRNA hydrolase [Firmicutes bacterium]|nr:aminoacyl-tRNA hydrolase [Bacillota bacterium]
MYLLVGLGNPGVRYAHTRHNAGFLIVDELARGLGGRFTSHPARALVARVALEGEEALLVKPQTYMNASGTAVAPLVHAYGVPFGRLLVILDDLDLPLGTLRFRRKGSAGGHRGLASIIASLGTEDFPRLRVGVGRPRGEAAEYVLSPFTDEERGVFSATVERAVEGVHVFVREGLEAAMNRFNGPPAQS